MCSWLDVLVLALVLVCYKWACAVCTLYSGLCLCVFSCVPVLASVCLYACVLFVLVLVFECLCACVLMLFVLVLRASACSFLGLSITRTVHYFTAVD